ncbi:MAG: TRAP transporter small permease subunit [Alphaproteobacteria bacterium]|nr:TRAP transporter small permease subunit [Alphaproteobacteria bacterium]
MPSVLAGHAAAAAILVLIVAICWEVVARYVFNAPTIWAHEIGYMLTGAGFLLGMSWTLRSDGHIRVDLLATLIGRRGQALIDLLGYALFILPVTLWLSWTLGAIAVEAWRRGEHSGQSAWNPLIWPFRALVCLGVALLALQVVASIVRAACALRSEARR